MLLELEIQNLAVISKTTATFEPGLNIITGETGAGKSVLLAALELVLGGRGSIDLIRHGEDALQVQAHFQIDLDCGEWPDIITESDVIISRTLNRQGRNKIHINGQMATVSQLSSLGVSLGNICRQGQQMKLLNSRYHLEILDSYAKNHDLLSEYQASYQEWSEARTHYETLESEYSQSESKREELEVVTSELKAISPEAGLRDKLYGLLNGLQSRQELLNLCTDFSTIINDPKGIAAQLKQLSDLAGRIDRIEPGKSSLESVANAVQQIAIAEEQILSLAGSENLEELSSEALEERLAKVAHLQRKYRTDDPGLVTLLQEKQAELTGLDNLESPEEFLKKLSKLKLQRDELAARLSSTRAVAAKKLSSEAATHLADLALAKAQFEVRFQPQEASPVGAETASFYIATNPGEPAKELKKVASGGEMSRILLAMKTILNQDQGLDCFIFDEVDTGISGATSQAVGEKLKSVAEQSQVICVTHLAQVAAMAEHHFRIEKSEVSEGSGQESIHSQICVLSKEDSIEELARMISGYQVNDQARAAARELAG